MKKIIFFLAIIVIVLSGCVTELEKIQGAVDTDGDGLTDTQEAILKTNPYQADSDGDGIIDSTDPNPLVPESKETTPPTATATPLITLPPTTTPPTATVAPTTTAPPSPTTYTPPIDSDNDKIADTIDLCPFEAGDISNEGCPDTELGQTSRYQQTARRTPIDSDNDKIADTIDLCPNQPGELIYDGCPKPSTIPLSTSSNNYIPKEYRWIFKGREYTWSLSFSEALYSYYRNKPRPPTRDYSVYATDPYDDKFISQLVNVFKDSAEINDFDKVETVNFVISFVQSLPYTPDDITTPYDEYPRYPVETLIAGGGDCEDVAILTVVLINELGYGAVLLELPQHMAVGVKCEESVGAHVRDDYGNNFCYLETTGEGWQIGQLPDEYRESRTIIRYLIPKPIITFEWLSKSVEANLFNVVYETDITVKNEGSATAENLKIWVTFDTTEEGMVYSQIEGKTYNLEPGSELKSVFTSPVPRGVYTRLHILVLGDNFLIQEGISEWFKT